MSEWPTWRGTFCACTGNFSHTTATTRFSGSFTRAPSLVVQVVPAPHRPRPPIPVADLRADRRGGEGREPGAGGPGAEGGGRRGPEAPLGGARGWRNCGRHAGSERDAERVAELECTNGRALGALGRLGEHDERQRR